MGCHWSHPTVNHFGPTLPHHRGRCWNGLGQNLRLQAIFQDFQLLPDEGSNLAGSDGYGYVAMLRKVCIPQEKLGNTRKIRYDFFHRPSNWGNLMKFPSIDYRCYLDITKKCMRPAQFNDVPGR